MSQSVIGPLSLFCLSSFSSPAADAIARKQIKNSNGNKSKNQLIFWHRIDLFLMMKSQVRQHRSCPKEMQRSTWSQQILAFSSWDFFLFLLFLKHGILRIIFKSQLLREQKSQQCTPRNHSQLQKRCSTKYSL